MDTWHPLPNAKHIVIWDENHDARMINNPNIEVAVSAAEVHQAMTESQTREMTPILAGLSDAFAKAVDALHGFVVAAFDPELELGRARRREVHMARCARRRERRRKARR